MGWVGHVAWDWSVNVNGIARSCYDLIDSAYDAKEIRAVSKDLRETLGKIPFSRLNIDQSLVDSDRSRRFNARSSVERINSQLKDNTGVRMIRERGHPKVHAFFMCVLLVIFAEALLALGR